MCLARECCVSLRRLGDAQLAAGKPDRALATFNAADRRASAVPYPCRVAEGHEGAAAAANCPRTNRQTAHCHLAAADRDSTSASALDASADLLVEAHLAELAADHRPDDRGARTDDLAMP